MAIFAHEHHHWAYVWIPVFTAFIWFSTLLAMFVTWGATGKPHYSSMEGNIPYISDIGADILKPLFIVGCSITGVGFVLTLWIERVLRNHGRLAEGMRRREGVFAWLAVLGAFIGGCGLILLSIFDTKRHSSLHRLFLLIFILGVGLSAIFSVIEFRWIAKDFGGYRRLRRAYVVKGSVAGALIVLAVAFAGCLYGKSTASTEAGAVIEWTISFGYTLYLLTFALDLRMSKGRHRGELTKEAIVARHAPGAQPATFGHPQQQHAPGTYANGSGGSPPYGNGRSSVDTYGTQAPLHGQGAYGGR